MSVIRYSVLIILYPYSGHLDAENLPSVYMPPFDITTDMSPVWVAKNYFYNGYPMTIQKFTSPKLPGDILEYYKNKWRSSGHGVQHYNLVGKARSIGYEEGEYSFSIQVENTSYGSQGALVVTKNKQYNLGPPTISIHSDNTILSRMHGLDDAVLSETIIINSSNPISLNQHWYDNYLTREGWKLQSHHENSSSAIVIYQHNYQQCQITYSETGDVPEHKVLIMIHCTQGIA